MSLLWVQATAPPTSGVLHGVDQDHNFYDAPYSVDHPKQVLDYARHLQESNPGLRISEMSHPGTCNEAGCKFYQKWVDGPQAFTKDDGTHGGGYKVHTPWGSS